MPSKKDNIEDALQNDDEQKVCVYKKKPGTADYIISGDISITDYVNIGIKAACHPMLRQQPGLNRISIQLK